VVLDMYPDERRILMTPGPVVFSIDVLRVMASTVYEHTSPDFAALHGSVIRGFRVVVGARSNSPVFVIPGSGTLAMEVALLNTVDPRSRVLVVSHGFFGDRWGEIARANGYDVTVISSEPGDVVPLDSIVEELSRGGYGAMLVSHVETSTGVRADLMKLTPIARTLTPRQTTHVKEALLKEDITIAHPGYKGKNHETQSHQNTPQKHQTH